MSPGWSLSATVVALWVTALGCQMSDGFYCGEPIPFNEQVVQACTGPNEVCDCATRSCAEKVDEKECASGYKYTSVPFARQELADRCVDIEGSDASRLISQHDDDKRCPLSGSGAGTGTGTGTGDQGGTAGQGGTGTTSTSSTDSMTSSGETTTSTDSTTTTSDTASTTTGAQGGGGTGGGA